jgi:hypothetical protein
MRVISGAMYAGTSEAASHSVWENFKKYGLETPEIVRMDNHLFNRHYSSVFHNFFDAIVTDPPYGIRAGAKKSGRNENRRLQGPIPDELRESHCPATQQYGVEEVMLDLLNLAAHSLKMGGYLSYLIPTTWDFTKDDLPVHPCLTMQKMCYQGLSTRHCRHMVVMQKTRDISPALSSEFADYKSLILSGKDMGFGQLIVKLTAALAADAMDNESVMKISSKSARKRRERKMKREDIKKDTSAASAAAGGVPVEMSTEVTGHEEAAAAAARKRSRSEEQESR